MDNLDPGEKLSLFTRSLETFDPQSSAPAAIVINLTYRCNLRCNMCIQYGEGFKEHNCPELSFTQWRRLIREISTFMPRVTLLGGEPLLYPDVKEILRELFECHCHTELVTNGYMLEKYIDEIVNYHVDLFISVDGTEEVHNSIRNSHDSFAKVRGVLERLNSREGSPGFFVNTVILPDNVDNILDLISWLEQYRPRLLVLQHPIFSDTALNEQNDFVWERLLGTRCNTNLFMRKNFQSGGEYLDKLIRLVSEIQSRFHEFKMPIYLSPGLSIDEIRHYYTNPTHPGIHPGRICSRPWRRLSIKPNGDVLACLDCVVGNISTESFSAIWSGERINRLRRALLEIRRFPLCTRCCDLYNDRDYLHGL